MKRLLAGALAAGLVSSAGGLGGGVAAAEGNDDGAGQTVYTVGGARWPGIPWYEYTDRSGRGWYPNASRVVVDYPAGAVRLPADLVPYFGTATVGESVDVGMHNLDGKIRSTSGSRVAVGLSEGALVLDTEQTRLANDPAAPPPDQLSFTTFGDPGGTHGFGKSLLASMFAPGTIVPIVDYRMPMPVESPYNSSQVLTAYDGIADFPDRPENLLSVANGVMGATFIHTPVAFTHPADVPPQNITTTTNSRGGTTTTYLVPSKYLPLTLPLRFAGVPDQTVNDIDAALKPMVDAGYSRNDNPASAPIGVDPVSGVPPVTDMVDQNTLANLDGVVNEIRGLLPPGIG